MNVHAQSMPTPGTANCEVRCAEPPGHNAILVVPHDAPSKPELLMTVEQARNKLRLTSCAEGNMGMCLAAPIPSPPACVADALNQMHRPPHARARYAELISRPPTYATSCATNTHAHKSRPTTGKSTPDMPRPRSTHSLGACSQLRRRQHTVNVPGPHSSRSTRQGVAARNASAPEAGRAPTPEQHTLTCQRLAAAALRAKASQHAPPQRLKAAAVAERLKPQTASA